MSKIEKQDYVKKVDNDIDNNIKILEKEKNNCTSLINKKQRALTMLYDDRANGVIDVTEFALIKNQYSIDIDEYNKRITQISKEIYELEKSKSTKKNQEEIFKKYNKLDKLTRVIIDEFIDKIYIGNIDPETKTRQFRIIWNINLD